MKKRRVKKTPLIVLGILIVAVFAIGFGVRYLDYRNSDTYKFIKAGYSKQQTKEMVETIKEKEFSKNQIKTLQELEKNDVIPDLIKLDNFLFARLDRYLNFSKKEKELKLKTVVSRVNTNTDRDFYEETEKTDITKGNAMLVNKYYYLDKNYTPKDIKDMSIQYAYDDNEIAKEVYEHYLDMWQAAKKEKGYILITTSSYRDYQFQFDLYNNYVNTDGKAVADTYAARPGYSEHQTGMALDIVCYGKSFETFDETEEYKWLLKHAHEYGFILRYPKGEEDITGYDFEPWHYRYLGVDLATKVYQSDLTFDEYYALYLA